jgi:hypothetical protein
MSKTPFMPIDAAACQVYGKTQRQGATPLFSVG